MRFVKLALIASFLLCGSLMCSAQEASDPGLIRGRRITDSTDLKGMLAKQRAEREKKDHREMLERGEQALRLVNQLEASFTERKSISPEDKLRLESLQEVVEKIRKELGGDDDDDDERTAAPNLTAAEEERPSSVEDAFKYLQKTTVKLVDELKKTSRFTISAIAIQSSNSVLRIVKFLRIRR